MLSAKSTPAAPLEIVATVKGLAVYLDNWTFIHFAETDTTLGERFVKTLWHGADLLLSIANVAELSGNRGKSLSKMKTFLDKIGPHWFPLEMDPLLVVQREGDGKTEPATCVSEEFIKRYTTITRPTTASGLVDLSADFFRLSILIDNWIDPHRDSIHASLREMDSRFINQINACRLAQSRDRNWLNHHYPTVNFNPTMPATFTYVNVIRALVEDKGYNLKKGDGADLCHAVMGAAFGSVMTLDNHWTRRIQGLPQPNQVAIAYSPPELEAFVERIEMAIKKLPPALRN